MNDLHPGVSLREFFDEKFARLEEKAEEIIALQKETNGRVRKAEIAIAILQWAYAVGAGIVGWLALEWLKR